MAELVAFRCKNCRAEYALPAAHRGHLEGKALFCPACSRWWLGIPASSGPPVKLVDGKPVRAPVDLRKFQRQPAASAPAAPSTPSSPSQVPQAPQQAPAPPATHPADQSGTLRVPITAPGRPSGLRVVVVGPETDLKGVFDLGGKSFLIGKTGCHLNLPQSAVPERAIRIRGEGSSFAFEGIDNFPIPVGPVSVLSGRIEPGTTLELQLAPYRIQLATSVTPGSPIAEIEPVPAATPAPAPAAPTPAAPTPAAPPVAPAPPAPAMPSPAPPVSPQVSGAPFQVPGAGAPAAPLRPAGDIRNQLQEIAIDVRPDQQAFGEEPAAMEGGLDQTVTDLGALGFQAMRHVDNPLDGLDLQLVKAESPLQGQVFKITKTPLLIGRAEGDVIVRDRRVSSKHAQLDIAGPRVYTLKDLASTNGTTVNDRPISVGHLKDGDILGFGGVKFEFHAKQVKS